MTTEEKLESFRKLQPGWNFGSGVAPSDVSLKQAKQALGMYVRVGVHETDAFCGPEGEVMITAYVNGHYIESDIITENSVNFLHEDGSGSILEKTTFSFPDLESHVRSAVQGAIGKQWLSFESSIRQTTTAVEASSTTTYSRIPARMVARQYSKSHAPTQHLETYVPISRPFTRELEGSHPHIGFSNYLVFSPPVESKSLVARKPRNQMTSVITMSRVPAMAISEGLLSLGRSATFGYVTRKAQDHLP